MYFEIHTENVKLIVRGKQHSAQETISSRRKCKIIDIRKEVVLNCLGLEMDTDCCWWIS